MALSALGSTKRVIEDGRAGMGTLLVAPEQSSTAPEGILFVVGNHRSGATGILQGRINNCQGTTNIYPPKKYHCLSRR